jgi:PD-(D/E)XK nuclease superfamily
LKLVVAIENKVDAGEADGQLERYAERLKSGFPHYRRLLVFLTPDGSQPSHGLYASYNYTDLAEVLEALTADAFEPAPEDAKLIIRHYVDMVRRHIVEDERLRTLALRLYERHKEALEFIFKYRPEPSDLLTVVRQHAMNVQGLIEDRSGSNLFRFVPEVWDQKLKIIKGDATKWTKTGRGILFEAKTYPDKPGRVNISLVLGPGNSDMRSRVYQAAAAQPKLFSGLVKPMGAQWVSIFSRDLLTSVQAKGLAFEAQSVNVGLGWSDFQAQSLMALINAVLAIDKELADSAESG